MPTPREEIEAILVDCHNDWEQMSAWASVFSEAVPLPFDAIQREMPVEVTGFQAHRDNEVLCYLKTPFRPGWWRLENLDKASLPDDIQHLLALYLAWREGDY